MSFNIEQTITGMLDAAKGVFAGEWPMIKDDMKRVLEDEKNALRDIAEARLRGDINDEELEEQLKDEKVAFQAGLSMVSASTKATIQRAIDAVSDVFWTAVKTAI
ncbi:hypothetical protein [Desulfobacula sp.]|uniref:hypothetical protein n=1 Tax=Desulfobacula sp. TaxID=2593537 RepID=UPI001ECA5085|nr:hypothetical protein [Desulfobacula sp.]